MSLGQGRCVYISGLPYSFENSRLLYRSIIWSSHDEEDLHKMVQYKLQCRSTCVCEEWKILCSELTLMSHREQLSTAETEVALIWIWKQMKLSGMRFRD